MTDTMLKLIYVNREKPVKVDTNFQIFLEMGIRETLSQGEEQEDGNHKSRK